MHCWAVCLLDALNVLYLGTGYVWICQRMLPVLYFIGKPRGRPPKFPKHCVEVGGVIKISDDSDSDSEDIDSDSNSSPESLQDNDDVIFVNHINGPTGRLTGAGYFECGNVMKLLVSHPTKRFTRETVYY